MSTLPPSLYHRNPIPHVQVGCFADFVTDATFSSKPRVRIIAWMTLTKVTKYALATSSRVPDWIIAWAIKSRLHYSTCDAKFVNQWTEPHDWVLSLLSRVFKTFNDNGTNCSAHDCEPKLISYQDFIGALSLTPAPSTEHRASNFSRGPVLMKTTNTRGKLPSVQAVGRQWKALGSAQCLSQTSERIGLRGSMLNRPENWIFLILILERPFLQENWCLQ